MTTALLVLEDSAANSPLNATARSVEPTNPTLGDVYLDDGTNTTSTTPGFRYYNGAAWEDLGGGGGSTLPVVDTTAIVKGSADATKLFRFEVDGFTTGVTRVATPPNEDFTIMGLATTQTPTNKTIDADNNTFLNLGIRADGRLTLTSGTAVTISDVLAATTIYFTPHGGNLIGLFDGTDWKNFEFTERSLSIPASTDTNYDIFIYDNAGTITLETAAWSSATARTPNFDLTLQDGVLVKSGATTRRYLGTLRTTGVSGQCEDSLAKRFVWNYYHRQRRVMRVIESTDSWAYTTAAYRAMNNSTANRLQFVNGYADQLVQAVAIAVITSTSVQAGFVGIGLDSTTTNNFDLAGIVDTVTTTGVAGQGHAYYDDNPGLGFHYLQALEWGNSGMTFYGDAGVPANIQAGIQGAIWG